MATFPGYVTCTAVISLTGDADPFNVTWTSANDSSYDEQTYTNNQHTVFAAAWASKMTNISTLDKVVCRFGQTPPAEDLIYESQNGPTPGTTSAEMLPQNVAVLVRKLTGLGGRKNRGRCYMPTVCKESEIGSTGIINTAGMTSLQGAADAWFSGLEGGGVGEPVAPMVVAPNVCQ